MAVKNAPPAGQFRMWRAGGPPLPFDDPRWAITCLLGKRRPRLIRGYGGWGQKKRTGRRARTTFEGSELPAYEIDLLLENDAVRSEGGTIRKYRNLERLAGYGSGDRPPPEVKWAANVPHDHDDSPRARWVVESLEWGESNSTDRAKLLWIEATLVIALVEDTELDDIDPTKGFDRRELKKGQNLREFAKRWLGDPKRWEDVAQLNADNPRCPRGPEGKAKRDTPLLVPPREPEGKGKKKKRGDDDERGGGGRRGRRGKGGGGGLSGG